MGLVLVRQVISINYRPAVCTLEPHTLKAYRILRKILYMDFKEYLLLFKRRKQGRR